MFFKKISQSNELKLGDIAKKIFPSALIFDAINGDLGTASDEIGKNSKKIIMAYGYARRVAVAALYIQGHFKKEDYDHVHAIFKSLQFQTDPSVEFQEQAFSDAIAFMQTYHQTITSVFAKALILIAQEYEVNHNKLDDGELIKKVLDFAYQKQHINSTLGTRMEDIVLNITQGVNSRIRTKEVALQFALEELDAARQGNEEAIQFVKNSWFNPSDYEGAMHNSFEEVDGPNGPQQFLLSSIMKYSSDVNFMISVRLRVLENIINDWGLETHSNEGDPDSDAGDEFWKWVRNNCGRVEFSPQEIETWGDLKELNLQSNELGELSYDISILTGLVYLCLFHNNYSAVPEAVFNLTELTHLNLGANQIAELPRYIGRLHKLKILDLERNIIISLPCELGELTNLEQLIVNNNNLASLPKEIGKMVALKHISMWDNNLNSLPDEIMNLNNLETIDLQNNNFTDEGAKKWIDKFSNTKCKISFGNQKGNISAPI